jgi:F-type H+-transporting ATPase subunit gamma
MASLKDMRLRIASVKSIRKITKAMQLVAASKLKKAQEAAEAARPYADRLKAVIANLAGAASAGSLPRMMEGTGADQTHLLVVLTAERGLCGGFNTQIVRRARLAISQLQAEGKTVKIITVGRKGRDQLRRDYANLLIDHVDLRGVRQVDGGTAQTIVREIMPRFEAGEFDVCTLVYSQFKNVLSQVPTLKRLIPAKAEGGASEDGPANIDLKGALYRYEPSEPAILETLLPRYLATQVLSSLLESAAGEQGARMTAMDNSTRNAGDLIAKLTIKYNRQRQANITKELIEIISGAEAL